MVDVDAKDRDLIGLLMQDSRASVTVLAARLKVSRATVQNRLARLRETGVITRFTVELASGQDPDLIRAIMMIEIEGSQERSILSHLRRVPEISQSYATNGKWDLVVMIEAASLQQFDHILREIRQIRGIRNSDTSILLANL